jgi:hypothetical protein
LSKVIAQPPEKLTLGTVLIVLGITASALLLRFHNLEEWGLWVDELFSVQHAAELAAGRINSRFFAYLPTVIALELSGVDMLSVDPRGIWTWRAAGITEWNMRAHVALLGAISILMLGLLGVRTFGTRASVLLCLLMALSPWHLWMSQSSRFYVQLFLLYNLALLLYYQAMEGRAVRRALVAMGCMWLACCTTPIALMIVTIFGVDVGTNWLRSPNLRMHPSFWAVGAASLAACVAAILVLLTGGIHRYFTFAGTPQPIAVMTMGTAYLVGTSMVVMAAFGFWAMLHSERRRLAILLLTSALLPLVIFAAFKLAGKDAHLRYLFVTLFPWLALAVVGIERIATTMQERWGAVASWLPAVALLSEFVVSDYVYMTGGAGYRGQWRQAMAYLEEHRRPGELVAGDLVGQKMAMYYLEESDAVLLPREGVSQSAMRELVPGPAWIVISVYEPSAGDRTRSFEAAGQLRAYFANRIAEPNHTINVYYYTPPAPTDDGSPAAVLGSPAGALPIPGRRTPEQARRDQPWRPRRPDPIPAR